jgi:azurin
MKIRFLPLAIFAALLSTACAKKETASAAASAPAPAPAAVEAGAKASSGTSAAPAATAVAARVIEITANDQMKFTIGGKSSGPAENLTIEAKPGEELKIVFKNAGTLPKEAMGHNWVLLKPGSDAMAFSTAAVAAKATDYVPDSLKDQVVVHTKLLGPRETAEVTFKVPAAGEYPFLCSFPAHFTVGMKGTLVAK